MLDDDSLNNLVLYLGAKKLSKNIEAMTGKKPNKFILVCWYFASPLFILIIWIFNWAQYTPITYGKYHYSSTAMTFGWFICSISIVAIPAGAIHTLWNSPEKKLINVFYLFYLLQLFLRSYCYI